MKISRATHLKRALLAAYPGWSVEKERVGNLTVVRLLNPDGVFSPPLEGERGAYTDRGPTLEIALENLLRTNAIPLP